MVKGMQRASQRLQVLQRQLHAESEDKQHADGPQAPAVVIGAAICDIQAQASGRDLEAGGTVPGTVTQTLGGVGRNIAQALAQLCKGWSSPLFITILGDDVSGGAVRSQWEDLRLPQEGLIRLTAFSTPSVVYCLKKDGTVAAGVASLDEFERSFTPQLIQPFSLSLKTAQLVILDGNLPGPVLLEAARSAAEGGARIWFEPVSTAKAVRAVEILHLLEFVSPNAEELVAMAAAVRSRSNQGKSDVSLVCTRLPAAVTNHMLDAVTLLQAGVKHIVLTLGDQGAALYSSIASGDRIQVSYRSASPAVVVNSNGAGDCLVAGVCMRLLQGGTPSSALAFGMAAAEVAIQSRENVPSELSYGAISRQASAKAVSMFETISLERSL